MQQHRKSLERIAIRYGLRCGLVLIFIFLATYFFQSEYGDVLWSWHYLRLTDLGIIKYMNLPIIFYIIYRGTRLQVRHNYCVISYQKSVLSGLYITVISILTAAFLNVIDKLIDPASLNLVMANHYLNPTTPRVERAFNFLRPYTITFIMCVIYTFLISLILKKEERSH